MRSEPQKFTELYTNIKPSSVYQFEILIVKSKKEPNESVRN